MKKLSQIVAQSGVQVFREIVPVALFSMVSSLVLLPFVFFFPVGLAVMFGVLLYVPMCTGVLYATHRMLDGEKPKLRTMWLGTVKHFGASLVFGIMMAMFVLILISSWWYYGSKSGTVYFVLAVFQTYFVAMAIVSQVYALPLVVHEGVGIFTAMGRSVKLFFANPVYTIGAFIQIICLTVVLGITIVGFAFLFVGMTGIYLNMLTANLIRKEETDNDGTGRKSSQDRELIQTDDRGIDRPWASLR